MVSVSFCRLSLARTQKFGDCVIDVSGKASSAATPSAPMGSAPRSSQASSTKPAATKDDATRAPPSTSSLVMPLSESARSTPPRLCGVARYRDRLAAGRADLVLRRHRQFQDYMGTSVAHAPEVSGVIARRLSRAEPDID